MVRSADVAVRSFQDQLRATKAARTRIDTQQMAARREVGRDLHIEIRFDGDAEVRLHAPAPRVAAMSRKDRAVAGRLTRWSADRPAPKWRANSG